MKRLLDNGFKDLDLTKKFIMNKEKRNQQREKKRMEKTKEVV
jgi:hypothetical protein